ncbi:hypothetical protein Cmtc_53910 [Cupriavidus sp. TKC]|nr:hypothetical protein Cmtc_53910 [Cupriavidus sp. TKC]
MIDESASARSIATDNLPLSESPEPVVNDQNATESVRIRLIKAALDGFLADDYHYVTTRRIAQFAKENEHDVPDERRCRAPIRQGHEVRRLASIDH